MPEDGSAILNGEVLDDGGLLCEYRFQYGTTPALGINTTWRGGALQTGDAFSETIRFLAPNTIYYFRAQVRNSLGTGSGDTRNFITMRSNPSVVARAATMVSEDKATINGTVTQDSGRPGRVYFEWGLTTAYGNVTPPQDGFATGDDFSAALQGLHEGTSIHYRAVFQSSPPVYSSDASLKTASAIGLMALADAEFFNQFMEAE